MSLFAAGLIHKDLIEPQVYNGSCRSSFDIQYVLYVFLSLVFFFGGNMFKPETQTFEFRSLEETQSFLHFHQLLEEGSHLFFF